jgi:hypothetical protein
MEEIHTVEEEEKDRTTIREQDVGDRLIKSIELC